MTTEEMRTRLKEAYPEADIHVHDMTGSQDHYQISITSLQFKGLSRIQRHQAVMEVFDAELKSGEVHALTIKADAE